MKIIQETRTIIKAEDGKVLRKKTTGAIVGDTVHLGYDYYDAGVPLAEPRLAVPDDYEEIDTPEDYQKVEIINQAKRLAVMQKLVEEEKKEISKRKLTAEEMLAVKNLYPRWGEDIKEGDTVTKGMKFLYTDGKLYAVRQDHTILPHYYPSVNTAALYEEITPEYNENGKLGTLDNPIAYDGNMALEEGKYYTQGGTVYLCTRNSEIAIYNKLADLIGIYVIEVTINTEDSTEENEEVIVEVGTLENPIEYTTTSSITLENGKYYSQDNVIYLCNRDSGNPVYHNLSDLVGLYVELV